MYYWMHLKFTFQSTRFSKQRSFEVHNKKNTPLMKIMTVYAQ